MGLGLLFAGMAGAGRGLASSAQEEQKVYDEERLMAERSRLEEARQIRIANANREAVRSANLKQGQEIESGVRQLQNERDAATINSKEGSTMTAADADVLRDKPEARKAYGLLGANRQTDLEDRATVAASLGYNDAATGYRTEARDEARDTANTKRLDAADRHEKFMENLRERQDKRAERLANAEIEYRKKRDKKEDDRYDQNEKREARLATAKNLDSVNSDIKSLERALLEAKKNYDTEGEKEIAASLKAARQEATSYRKALASVGVKMPDDVSVAAKPITSAPPDGTRLRKGGKMYVVRNGIPIPESE